MNGNAAGRGRRGGQFPASVAKAVERVSTATFWLIGAGRGVEHEQHFAAAAWIEARHGEQARLVRCVADYLLAAGQRRMAGADARRARQSRDRAGDLRRNWRGRSSRWCRSTYPHYRSRPCSRTYPGARPGRHRPGKPLLVARIDGRDSAQHQQHGVAEHVPLENFGGARRRIAFAQDHAEPAIVVIAKEGRQLERGGHSAFIERIGAKQLGQLVGPGVSTDRISNRSIRMRNRAPTGVCRGAC